MKTILFFVILAMAESGTITMKNPTIKDVFGVKPLDVPKVEWRTFIPMRVHTNTRAIDPVTFFQSKEFKKKCKITPVEPIPSDPSDLVYRPLRLSEIKEWTKGSCDNLDMAKISDSKGRTIEMPIDEYFDRQYAWFLKETK